jgi:hypothetical protein
MRTTIRLDDQLLKEAKKLAAENGRTLASVIEDALRESLGRRLKMPVKPAVRLPRFGSGGLQPGVDLDDSSRLRELMDGQ